MPALGVNQIALQDAVVLYSANVVVTGPTAWIDTTGFQSIVIEINNGAAIDSMFTATLEGTITQFDAYTLQTVNMSEYSINDQMLLEGHYSATTTSKYVRLNIANLGLNNFLIVNILGRSSEGYRGADLLSLALDKENGIPLQVQLPVNLKQDIQGALVASDAPAPILWESPTASSILVVDTSGYETVIFHQQTAGIVTPTVSNDGVNYVACTMCLTSASTTLTNATTAAGMWIIPVTGRYIKFTGPASVVTAAIYLRQAPFNLSAYVAVPPVNTAQIGGTAVVNAGVAGLQAIGGNIAAGTAPTSNPIPIGAIDVAGLTRRILSNMIGHLMIALQDQQNTGNNVLRSIASSYQNIPRIPVSDVTQFEGNSKEEMFAQILLELQILNQQIFELPNLLNSGSINQTEPGQYRIDPSAFQT